MNRHATRIPGWDPLLTFTRWTSYAVLVFMVVTICYDSVTRYLVFSPTNWSMEINSFLIVYLAILGAAEVQRQDAHIRITFFVDRLSPCTNQVIRRVCALAGAVFCVILAWWGGGIAYNSFKYGERVSSAFGTPLGYPYAIIPIGFGLLGLQFAIDFILGLRRSTEARAIDSQT